MESSCIFTMKNSIWTFILLSLVVVCWARPDESSFSSEKPDLRLETTVDSGTADIILWHSREGTPKASVPSGKSGNVTDCQQSYGFLPCSRFWSGSAFLLLVYGFISFMAVGFLSKGSQLLLTVSEAGVVGGFLLPILKTLPASFLILVTLLAKTTEDAQNQALVGMGVLAGTTIALLGLVWGNAIFAGRCDFDSNGVARDRRLTKAFSFKESGITTEAHTRQAAWIMLLSVIPYMVIQIPVLLGTSQKTVRISVLAAGVVALVTLAGYCIYQLFCPWVQNRLIYRAQQLFRRSYPHADMTPTSELSWLLEDGETPNQAVLEKMFKKFDSDGTGHMSEGELRGWIMAMGLEYGGVVPEQQAVKAWMKKFDVRKTGKISQEEFVNGMDNWIRKLKDERKKSQQSVEVSGSQQENLPLGQLFSGTHELELSMAALLNEIREDEIREMHTSVTKEMTIVYAVVYIIGGLVVSGFAAIPTVGVIGDFSKATGVSPFIVSFIVSPLILILSEGVGAVASAGKKGRLHITTIFAKTYGEVTMINTMALAIYLVVFYYKGLTWDYLSEVLAIVLTFVIIGLIASVRVHFPLWIGIMAMILYPLLLVMLIAYRIIIATLTSGIDLKFPVWEGVIALIVYPVVILLLIVWCQFCLPRLD